MQKRREIPATQGEWYAFFTQQVVVALTELIMFLSVKFGIILDFVAAGLRVEGECGVPPHYFLIFLQEEIALIVFTALEPVMFKQAGVFFFSPIVHAASQS